MFITLVKPKHFSRKTKIRVNTTVIRPTVAYACETRVLNRTEKEKLGEKMLRALYG